MKMSEIYFRLLEGTLLPRYHSGVGMIQLYLTDTVRLHVFHPELRARAEAFGNRHSHRFDMTSTVLLGTVIDSVISVETAFHTGHFRLYDVTPAHLFNGDQIPTPADDIRYNMVVRDINVYGAGALYKVPAGAYHETRTEGLTVTLMKKSNQVEEHAKIIAHEDQRIVHAMASPPSQILLNQLFWHALRRLSKEAGYYIENQTGG